jgi:hypothetical protein
MIYNYTLNITNKIDISCILKYVFIHSDETVKNPTDVKQ